MSLFSLVVLTNCSQLEESRIYIVNKSNTLIDSITFPVFPQFNSGRLNINYSQTIIVKCNLDNREGAFDVLIWQKDIKRIAGWGFHDYGRFLSGGNDTIVVADHYISLDTKEVKKPKLFELFITDSTGGKIDSVYFEKSVLHKTTFWEEKQMKYVLDYELIEKKPKIKVSIDNRIIEIAIPRDWSSWDYPFTGITIFPDGNFKRS